MLDYIFSKYFLCYILLYVTLTSIIGVYIDSPELFLRFSVIDAVVGITLSYAFISAYNHNKLPIVEDDSWWEKYAVEERAIIDPLWSQVKTGTLVTTSSNQELLIFRGVSGNTLFTQEQEPINVQLKFKGTSSTGIK